MLKRTHNTSETLPLHQDVFQNIQLEF